MSKTIPRAYISALIFLIINKQHHANTDIQGDHLSLPIFYYFRSVNTFSVSLANNHIGIYGAHHNISIPLKHCIKMKHCDIKILSI
ncbi:hypothetical protein DNX30_03660 [Escherichia coli]|uniref:Uncharacterized protein n=1 Tax=Escherichia coli TaxID=562 RepID=A0A3R0N993_ECOLX|nr:hypothetical protein [Escherichia coli]EFI3845798.1 hypothetical protein [Escherichia coli]EFI8982176.1 hypothetical protein [Escherichia coli]EFJ0488567.1 hypothetical protein [Escherichia coli]MJL91865.1 hypothetical protein [Escherichia coli]